MCGRGAGRTGMQHRATPQRARGTAAQMPQVLPSCLPRSCLRIRCCSGVRDRCWPYRDAAPGHPAESRAHCCADAPGAAAVSAPFLPQDQVLFRCAGEVLAVTGCSAGSSRREPGVLLRRCPRCCRRVCPVPASGAGAVPVHERGAGRTGMQRRIIPERAGRTAAQMPPVLPPCLPRSCLRVRCCSGARERCWPHRDAAPDHPAESRAHCCADAPGAAAVSAPFLPQGQMLLRCAGMVLAVPGCSAGSSRREPGALLRRCPRCCRRVCPGPASGSDAVPVRGRGAGRTGMQRRIIPQRAGRTAAQMLPVLRHVCPVPASGSGAVPVRGSGAGRTGMQRRIIPQRAGRTAAQMPPDAPLSRPRRNAGTFRVIVFDLNMHAHRRHMAGKWIR